MADGDPYPIKAFFVLGNNALLSYPNQHQIHRGMLNQELIVAHEIFMTPTAMLADYVLPGDVFSERNHIADSWAWASRLALSDAGCGRTRSRRARPSSFWTDLARTAWTWASTSRGSPSRSCIDHRLRRPRERTLEGVPAPRSRHGHAGAPVPEVPEDRLRDALGQGRALVIDPRRTWASTPCPTTVRRRQPTAEYPYLVFSGVREDPFFQTGQRNIGVLRRRSAGPEVLRASRRTPPATGSRRESGRGSRPSTGTSTPGSRIAGRHAAAATCASPTAGGTPRPAATGRPRRRLRLVRRRAHHRHRRSARPRAGHPALPRLPRPDRRVRPAGRHVRDDARRVR